MNPIKISADLSLPLEAVTQTFAILAKRGAGKTYTGAVLVEEMLEAGQQVVVADPIGVWWGLRSSADGDSPGYKIVVFGGEHADVPLEEHSGEVIASAIIEHGFSAILDLSLLRKGAQVRFMTAFAETLYRLNRKPLHFVVDEADAFAPQRPQQDEARLLGAFEDIVRRGRARGLGVTLITQRAAVINKNVLTQIEVLVCLRTIAPQDREAIDAWIEVHGTEAQREKMMAELPSLPIGTAFFWSPGWLDIFKKVAIRKRRTFDSSSTPKVGQKITTPKEMAAVDLKALGAQITSTVERAKENDPALLKAELARLKKEHAAELKKAATVPTQTEIKEVPALTDAERKRLTKLIDAFEDFTKTFNTVRTITEIIASAKDQVSEELQFFRNLLDGKFSQAKPQFKPQPYAPREAIAPSMGTRPAAKQDSYYLKAGAFLPHGEGKILSACIQFPTGVTRQQLTVLTTFKRSTRDAYIARLRERGLVLVNGDTVEASELGIAAMPEAQPLPTGLALQEHWLNILPAGEAVILRFILNAYPKPVSRDEISEQTGFKRSTRDAYLSRMAAKLLFTEPQRGMVRASEQLI